MKRQKSSIPLREKFHMRMAMLDTLGHLALFSVLVGMFSGLVIVAFRFLIAFVQASFLPGGDAENYEALAWYWRLALPVVGGLLIGLLFHAVEKRNRQVGVVHVMERLAYHQAHLPLTNAVMQFVGAAISIISGHSVGREGPAIHLGATSGSQLGQWLHLPNNSTRTLVACGIAAAIAASFNTPLAGVIFSMEVILLEYTLAGFIPVILAAVTATALSQFFHGSEPAFSVPAFHIGSLLELPYVLLTGVFIGVMAALFIQLLQFFSRRGAERPLWLRTTVAGIAVGLCAVAMPPVMGIGYDTVNAAMLGNSGITLLLAIMAFKILATTVGLGLGLPGGLIGPTLVIGATGGAAIGLGAAFLNPDTISSPALYAMIGMGAMMGATLQAPLAALTALLELTANPNIILPGMLAIISASLVSSQIFGKGSVFTHLLRARGLDYNDSPIAQSLRRVSVAKAMDRECIASPVLLDRQQARLLLQGNPHWLVIRQTDRADFIVPAADLARHLASRDYDEIDLQQMPAQHRQATAIDLRASLQEAFDTLIQHHVDALYVMDLDRMKNPRVLGVVTREDIEENYHYSATSPHP